MIARTFRLISYALLAALFALTSLSCKSSKESEPEWSDANLSVQSESVLWECVRLAFQRQGLPILAGFDPNTKSVTSGWDIELAPFRGQGFREKARVEYARAEEGGIDVNVRVLREANMALSNPLDLSYAEWEKRPDNARRARLILEHLRYLTGHKEDVNAEKKPRDPFTSPFESPSEPPKSPFERR